MSQVTLAIWSAQKRRDRRIASCIALGIPLAGLILILTVLVIA